MSLIWKPTTMGKCCGRRQVRNRHTMESLERTPGSPMRVWHLLRLPLGWGSVDFLLRRNKSYLEASPALLDHQCTCMLCEAFQTFMSLPSRYFTSTTACLCGASARKAKTLTGKSFPGVLSVHCARNLPSSTDSLNLETAEDGLLEGGEPTVSHRVRGNACESALRGIFCLATEAWPPEPSPQPWKPGPLPLVRVSQVMLATDSWLIG